VPPETIPPQMPELTPAKRALLEARLRGLSIRPTAARREARTEAPLSFAQERLWFLNRLQPESAFYNVPLAWRMTGTLDRAALERALGEIVRRHDVLRTTFQERDGTPLQVVAPAGGFTLPVEDLSALAGAEREAEVRRQTSEDLARRFDLEAGPLFRAKLLRLGAKEHVLLACMHHAVTDGWSMGVLFRELSALYQAYSEGKESPLAELPLQYTDFAVRQREHLQGEVLERQLSYWRKRLTGAPGLLELPTDRPRPAVQSYRGARERVEISGGVLERLKELAQQEGGTLYMVVLGAFQVLLSKYAGTDDVVVGSSISGRTRREVEELIGFFVNTLVLRTDLSGDPTFREVLGRVKEVTLGAFEHQELPFEKLVAELQPERSLSHSPLFQVMFTLNNTDASSPGLPGLTIESAYADSENVKFDLNLAVVEHPGGLRAILGYNTDLFDRGTIQRLLRHLRRVLEQVADDPAVPLSGLRLLDAEERRNVLEEWNATQADYPADRCVHQLFEAQAERTPDAVAVVYEGEALSYGELNARANQLAHHLVGLGVGPDVRVGICMERGLEMPVTLLAILKAGGAYVPLDPAYPAERLRQMLEDSRPAALLTHGATGALFGDVGVPVIDVEAESSAWSGRPRTNPERGALTPDHLCYVIYTSGSTGKPKGVMNQHRTVVNRMGWWQRAWRLGADEAILCKTSLSFDGSLRETFWPWSVGARMVMARPEGHKDPDHLLEMIRREQIGAVNLVPSMLQVLLEHPEIESCAGLRQIICTGEALPGPLLARFHERLPHVALHNLYGPSEAATAVAECACTPEGERATVPIGRPTSNVRIYLLDEAGEPVPVGVPGELYIGGVGVARGYLDRPELTAEKFVPDSFGGEPGARLYRTGDLARWLADGRAEFLGRNDFQVKIRGFRVELGEIEARLAKHPAVRDSAVTAREDSSGEKRLVAYYVGAQGVEVEVLRAYLSEELPDYMVPAAYVRLEALPLTPNGKLDRRALPAPQGDAFVTRAYEAPVGETEAAVAEIWSDVLGVERVGRWDHFFELGGHSLRAVQVVSRVRQVLEVEVALSELFLRPVLADFARGLEQGGRAALPPIERVSRDGHLPLSFAQQRLWFVEQMGETGAAYHIPVRLRLKGALDREALLRALDRIVARHEALRTVFESVDGEPVQRIVPEEASHFLLLEHDLAGYEDTDVELARLVRAEASALFDLFQGPLIRGRLIRLATDDHVLLVTMHHVVSDGWSMGVLIQELGVLYGAFLRGEADPLPPLPVQYADYAAWQRRWMDGEVLKEQADYWKGALSGAPERLELPTDHPRPVRQDYTGAVVWLELDEALTAGLKALSRRQGTTLFMTLLTGWSVVLSRLSGQEDVVIGTPAANRGRREIEGLIGFFINTLALRLDLSGSPALGDLLAQVKTRVLGAQQHQDMPFEQVVEVVQPARSLAHTPLFQVVLAWQNTPRDGLELPGLTLGSVGVPMQVMAKYDLSLTLYESGGRIAGGVTYATALFEQETVERWMGYLRRVLEAMVADERQPVVHLALMDAEERSRVVEEWNRTERPYPRNVCIHELFEDHVRERPGAVALVWGEESLSYAELDARANRLAHHLIRLGVGPDARVGVLLERGVELIVSILAVLKAGGCYVPLDPTYPAERLALMLADSNARVLLTRTPPPPILGEGSTTSFSLAPRIGGEVASLGEPERGPAERGRLHVVYLDQVADALASESAEAPRSGATAENLAYIVYTSGSTGKPKGVMVAHRHVVQLVRETDYVQLRPGDRVAQASNASFDALTFEAWGAFLNGATLVGIPRDVLLSPAEFRRVLREERITTLYQTTALLNQLSREEPDIFAPLREVLFGGQQVDADSVRRLLKAGKPQRLLHMYGPTETTAWCSWEQVEQVEDGALTVSVGRATGNQRIYLLDAALNPVPVGVPGEAYVGGDGVVRGYLDRPGLTAERFLPDPFAVEPGARMYRTGDKLRWRADGRLEFIGRLDEQVKIRGFRIEPGEIEAVLSSHPAVREGRVIVREDEPGEKRLVAYLVGSPDGESLREHLRRSLPEYMVPAAFVALDGLPLTPNGKLDVKALPAPEYAAEDRYVAPRTPVEEVLAGIWAEVLRVERVGVDENFFDLGGHSLLATRVVSRIREAFAVELTVRALFEGPTVAELAERVEALRRAGLPPLPPIERISRDGHLPLSFAQERLWFLDRLQPESAFYNIPVALRLSGALDSAALERALGEIVRRHEALRTTFRDHEDAPVQVIRPFEGFALPVEDLSALAEMERDADVRRRASAAATRPFDLAVDPLFRAELLRLSGEEHVLLLCMHHIVSDGWSMGVLYRELSVLYEAYREGRESPLADLPVQYADYAAWQREQLRGEALERQLGYWRERLADAPALLELPTDHPRPAVQTYDGASERVEFPAELLERLRKLGQREGATLYMVVLGAFQVLLSKYAGTDDVVVGSPIAGRTRREVEDLIGFFVNTLVLRTDLSGNPSFRALLARVRETTLGAYEHQEVPFEKLVAELQPERSLSHSPLFQVMFSLVDADRSGPGLPGVRVASLGSASETVKFDFNLVFGEHPDGLRAVLAYNTGLFERGTILRVLGHLERVLEQVAENAEVRLSEVELLGTEERARVVAQWNRTERAYPEAPVHALFAEHARRAPGAVALLHARSSMTYGELDRRVDALARRLRELGVGPEVPVGVCMERTPELLVGVLGVWRAGGVFVPLDPGYPAERLAWIAADAGLKVVVTAGSAAGALPEHGAAVVRVDELRDAPPSAPLPEGAVSPANLAYVIYTSGSTGRPKGVQVQHGSLSNFLAAMRETLGARPGDVMPALASYAFDIWLFEALLPLTSGAATRVVERERVLDVPALLAEAADATLMHAVPALMKQVVDVEREAPRLTRLRRAFVGGDSVPAGLLAEMRAALPGAETHVFYGPTEGTILASVHAVPADGVVEGHPIGAPLGNVRVYVCDALGSPQPVGVPGELMIGGAGVARGYLGRPELTAERFVPDPFSGAPGARLYRTGDRARWRADGTLEYQGRLDGQVKIRGFRIEPGEIEAALGRHDGVAECVVVVREDTPGEKRLVAYVVGSADAEELREHLRRSLPDYMVPAAFVALDSIPLSPNGKLDRRALPAPALATGPASPPPRNELEEKVAEVWRSVLGLAEINVHDNFFDLGGSSLLLHRVYSRLKEHRGDLRVIDLFRYTTVEALARHLGAEEPRDAGHLAESRSRAEERRASRRRLRGG